MSICGAIYRRLALQTISIKIKMRAMRPRNEAANVFDNAVCALSKTGAKMLGVLLHLAKCC